MYTLSESHSPWGSLLASRDLAPRRPKLKIHQRGVQWKQGVVIYMMLYTICIIQYYPNPLHPPPTAPPCNEYPKARAIRCLRRVERPHPRGPSEPAIHMCIYIYQ